MRDIVYVIRNDINSKSYGELRYSLRSVAKNFKFNKIWIYGGCPDCIQPDHWVNFQQTGINKWERTRSTYSAIMKNDEITPEFYLFNDDFFIMHPYDQDPYLSNGTLNELIDHIVKKHNGVRSLYVKRLEETERYLRQHGFDTKSFESHTPFLINRELGAKTLNDISGWPIAFRSSYGNMNHLPTVNSHDFKLINPEKIPANDWILASTSEKSFRTGQVGSYIRTAFPDKCRYEKET